jgi:hypothetical protein
VADPVRFGLVFGVPIPGFEVPESAGTVECAHSALMALESVVLLASVREPGLHPPVDANGPVLNATLFEGRTVEDGELSAEARQAMFLVWASLHGVTCLEVFNHMDWMPVDAREEFFRAQVDLCMKILGL